ncbi:hypothetical protein MNEG_3609 [Monoraphidium neglectum]|uniref:Uncharacterized protein n=1 Tax=Monoraphidium neglectum TaxID=145388 RepID=A0A0D2LC76_9CHLO|nr:hypothetical protein MNEG_3609 [Monoraphidium neglectum]KIZ04354.1 hypothetical protein MNEG_3609 [Monoraphidium neglectum]|eukprot:XP_013903373.1 hypothetical protein MNEG_3609 [Monoraphidium neglectum]
METGLCYARCPLGSVGVGCSCWRDGRSTWRGCGVRPRTCRARSFRPPALPPVPAAERGRPFTLLLSADPQLWRNYTKYDDRAGAERINRRLVRSINAVRDLKAWPADAGGGEVEEPRSMNHDYVNNVGHCSEKAVDSSFCPKWAVAMMRSALSPDCPSSHWAGLPKSNVTSLDIGSMSYSFGYGRYYFIVLQHSPRYEAREIGIAGSMGWLARELAMATAAGRRVVLLLHAHKELQLAYDPTFSRLVENSNVVAIFYGHVHIRPWGLVGRYPNTSVPMYNCGAAWYNVYCLAEFGEDSMRVGAVAHYGDAVPTWFGTSLHSLPRGQRGKPVLEVFVPNPNVTTWWKPASANASTGADAVADDAQASGGGSGALVPAGSAAGGSGGGDGDGNGGGAGVGPAGKWSIKGRRLLARGSWRGLPWPLHQ